MSCHGNSTPVSSQEITVSQVTVVLSVGVAVSVNSKKRSQTSVKCCESTSSVF